MPDDTVCGTVRGKHVKEFAVNNKMITTLLGIIVTAVAGNGAMNSMGNNETSNEVAVMEYRLQVAEESVKEQANDIEELTKTLWKHDIFSSIWNDGFEYTEAPQEYNNTDSGSFLWARNKIIDHECKFASRSAWLNDDNNKKRKKAKKLENGSGPTLYPRIMYDFEDEIPYVYSSAEKRKVWIPIDEDRAATDWQMFDCIEKEKESI